MTDITNNNEEKKKDEQGEKVYTFLDDRVVLFALIAILIMICVTVYVNKIVAIKLSDISFELRVRIISLENRLKWLAKDANVDTTRWPCQDDPPGTDPEETKRRRQREPCIENFFPVLPTTINSFTEKKSRQSNDTIENKSQ